MPTTMMTYLQTNAPTYVDNEMKLHPLLINI